MEKWRTVCWPGCVSAGKIEVIQMRFIMSAMIGVVEKVSDILDAKPFSPWKTSFIRFANEIRRLYFQRGMFIRILPHRRQNLTKTGSNFPLISIV